MARILPKKPEEIPHLAPVLEAGKQIMGFIPNDGLTMAYRPDILQAFLGLVQSIYAPGIVSPELKRLVGLIASQTTGCRYCQAHAGRAAAVHGASQEKIAAVWEFQTSDLFSEAEKAALSVAMKASMVPNAVEDKDFDLLKGHFSAEQIIEITSVIAMYGFLNRWNATLDTDLEEVFS